MYINLLLFMYIIFSDTGTSSSHWNGSTIPSWSACLHRPGAQIVQATLTLLYVDSLQALVTPSESEGRWGWYKVP